MTTSSAPRGYPPLTRHLCDEPDEMIAHLVRCTEHLLGVIDDAHGSDWRGDTSTLDRAQELLHSVIGVIGNLIEQAQKPTPLKRRLDGVLRFTKGDIRFPHVVKLDDWPSGKDLQIIRNWCTENCGHDKYDWMIVCDKSIEFHFRDARMMTVFLLYWQGTNLMEQAV